MSSNNEWYTPHKYIEAAREVMGGIDLDPASCALANETVQAKQYYTKEDNGLMQPWYGHVWMNPPFGKTNNGNSNLISFLRKLIICYQNGQIQCAVALAPSNIDASWFQWLWEYPICFTDHEVDFYETIPHKRRAHIFGTIFVYLGPNEDRFIEVFSRFGRVVKAIDTPKPKPIMLDLWQTAAS